MARDQEPRASSDWQNSVRLFGVKLDTFVSNIDTPRFWYCLEDFNVSGGKMTEGVIWVGKALVQLVEAPLIVLHVLLVF